MEELYRKRNEAFVKALKENPRKATMVMRDESGGRCCLCVARDVAKEGGCVLPENEPQFGPEKEVGEWFGWNSPELLINGVGIGQHNDGFCADVLTHKEIAELIEKEYLNK